MTPDDLQTFNNAIALSQTNKIAAFGQFHKLSKIYPYNSNLWLWIIYTAPTLAYASHILYKLRTNDPGNPHLPAAIEAVAERARQNPHAVNHHIYLGAVGTAIAFTLATLVLAGVAGYMLVAVIPGRLSEPFYRSSTTEILGVFLTLSVMAGIFGWTSYNAIKVFFKK